MSYRPVTHVIFDCDGLLLDTETIYEKVYTDLAAEHGKYFDFGLRMKILGLTRLTSCKTIVEELKLPMTPEEVVEYQVEKEKELLPGVRMMPGVERLVRHLVLHKIPIAIATSSTMEAMEMKMSSHRDLWGQFSHTVAGGSDPEVKRGKPAPDIFLVCASKFSTQPKPEECLVFEDALNGVEGALAAGMQVVMVPDPRVPREGLPATQVISSLQEFQPELFGLPPF
ncbi:pseudouridine-5'-phosphatase-like [Bacillus rossius redtenbacheri]|uniref:pseudouridine-5'-phosphatase-like n=1 Tax=Bacillus rossius redtenbacheri TaxID=93214 RepID=UPI002FDE16EA